MPRWTHKFRISKGYVTTRNKHMRCEKLYYTYDVMKDRYLAVRATKGKTSLMGMAVPLVRQTVEAPLPSTPRSRNATAARASTPSWRPRASPCCVNTVAKLMHDNDIRAKTARKFRNTTDSNHPLPVADNLLFPGVGCLGPKRLSVPILCDLPGRHSPANSGPAGGVCFQLLLAGAN